MHYVKYKEWWDVKGFQQPAMQFERDGSYCPFPASSNAYTEYWDQIEHHIHNGFVHEGQHCTGLHFLYQNFCPIKDKSIRGKLSFPKFWAIDDAHFTEVEWMMGIGANRDNKDPAYLSRPCVWLEAKSRQVGSSLKGMVPVLYNMLFVPYSVNYLTAWHSSHYQKTLDIYLQYHNFCYRHTDFGKGFMKQTAGEHYITGYYAKVNGKDIPAGYQSQLIMASFMNNTTSAVGGPADLFIIEEKCLHPKLDESIGYLKAMCKDGDLTTGCVIGYGAIGKETASLASKKVFYGPHNYDVKAYKNIWDQNKIYPYCGFFVPNYAARKGHIDENGNPNQQSAIAARQKVLDNITDQGALDLELSQYCNEPSEMFRSRGNRRFRKDITEPHVALLKSLNYHGDAVVLENYKGKVSWRFRTDSDPMPLIGYPVESQDGSWTGCPVMYEPPEPQIPDNLYIASIDSYNQEQSEWTKSFGSILIYKRQTGDLSSGRLSRVVVAEYIGRPQDKYDFYKTCRDLLIVYNAVALPENEDTELIPWFINNRCDHLLADQPDIIQSIIPNSKVKRRKGIHADEDLIIAAENAIERYINKKLGAEYDADGKTMKIVYQMSAIPSLGLAAEIHDYLRGNNRNYDRVRTFGWLLLYETELETVPTGDEDEEDVVEFLTQGNVADSSPFDDFF